MEAILETIHRLYWDEIVSLICGIVYVVLASRNNPLSWIFGILGSALFAYGTYAHYGLLFDSILNIIYVCLGFYGIYQWIYGGNGDTLPIRELNLSRHVQLIIAGIFLSLGLSFSVSHFQLEQVRYSGLDAFTTVFSLIATYILARRAPSNWLYWIITDVAYVHLYYISGAWTYMFLFILYSIVAVYGYFHWQMAKIHAEQ